MVTSAHCQSHAKDMRYHRQRKIHLYMVKKKRRLRHIW